MSGILYSIATPIGNLEDITLRALRVLREVDGIACEDTRVTKKLLFRYEIKKTLFAYHQHSADATHERIIALLEEGKNIAVVTDAGTPGVSDPGNRLVRAVIDRGFRVVPIPGPSAIAAIVSVAGIDMQQFCFLGFVPHKKGRQTFFDRVLSFDMPSVYYDSTHRVVKNLALLAEKSPEVPVIVGRELTKQFEEIVHGTAHEVVAYFSENPEKTKGEFSIIVAPTQK